MARSVLTISLPHPDMKQQLQDRARQRGHASLSAYILHALAVEEQMIHDDDVLRLEAQAIADYERGETTAGLDHLRAIAA